jgi:hypothetical protein
MAPGYLHAVRPEMLGKHAERAGQGRLSQHHFAVPGLLARPQIGERRRPDVQDLSLGRPRHDGRGHDEESEGKSHALLHRVHHVEDRQVHRDDHAAYDHTEDHDHHRLHQREQG